MTDIKKDDDPTIIPEADMEDVAGGMKIPNIFSGDSSIVDSFTLAESPSITAGKLDKADIVDDKFEINFKTDPSKF